DDLAGAAEPFVVPTQPGTLALPREGALHHPAAREHPKTRRHPAILGPGDLFGSDVDQRPDFLAAWGMGHDLRGPAEGPFNPLFASVLPVVGGVQQDVAQPRELGYGCHLIGRGARAA